MERSSVIFWRLEGEKSSSGGLKIMDGQKEIN
jgi:hypothetical protein